MRSDWFLVGTVGFVGALLVLGLSAPAPAVSGAVAAASLGSALSTLDDARAEATLRAGLKHDASDPRLNLALARLAMREEQFPAADGLLQRAEKGLPADLEVALARVDWWVATGAGRKALARLEELAGLHPDDPRVPLAQAEANRRLMRFKACLPFYQKYLAMPDPDKHRRDVHKLRYVRITNALQEFEAQTRKEEKR